MLNARSWSVFPSWTSPPSSPLWQPALISSFPRKTPKRFEVARNSVTPATSIDAQDSAGFKRWVCCLIAKDLASRIWWKPWDGILA
jgi:hypothetical protein